MTGAHVDGIITVASNKDCLKLQEKPSKFFRVKHFDVLTWYMGCSFKREPAEGKWTLAPNLGESTCFRPIITGATVNDT